MAESVPDVHDRDEAEIEFGRIVAFSDGVFTIAITLLVLSLEVPPGGDLSELLSERAEQFFAYFLSFAVTAPLLARPPSFSTGSCSASTDAWSPSTSSISRSSPCCRSRPS